MSLFDLTGKVAVITGSSRGIGKAIAERMAEHGARVVISSRKLEPCEEVAAQINARHGLPGRPPPIYYHKAALTWLKLPAGGVVCP